MKRKLVLVAIVVVLLSVMTIPAYAADDDVEISANALHALGLFNGTGTDAAGKPIYDLDRVPTRNEAVTMLVRLLGKENEAKSRNWETPFTDVAVWAQPYVGYTYVNGLTNGTSATTFGGDSAITATQYITFLLRALGYESGLDFEVNTSYQLGNKIGLTTVALAFPSGVMHDYSDKAMYFNRGHVALLSASALQCYFKDGHKTLIANLYEDGVISEEALQSYDVQIAGIDDYLTSNQRLDEPKNVKTYYDETGGRLEYTEEKGLYYSYYYATSYNGPYVPGGESTGGVFIDVYYEEGKTYYYIISAEKSSTNSNGDRVTNYSNWSDPVSLNSATAEKPPVDPNKTLTTYLQGAAVYYPAGVSDPTIYLENAYASARALLKYPVMAKPSAKSTILSFDEASGDLYLFGYILGCNAFGVYSDCNYCAIFKDANPYDYIVTFLTN